MDIGPSHPLGAHLTKNLRRVAQKQKSFIHIHLFIQLKKKTIKTIQLISFSSVKREEKLKRKLAWRKHVNMFTRRRHLTTKKKKVSTISRVSTMPKELNKKTS